MHHPIATYTWSRLTRSDGVMGPVLRHPRFITKEPNKDKESSMHYRTLVLCSSTSKAFHQSFPHVPILVVHASASLCHEADHTERLNAQNCPSRHNLWSGRSWFPFHIHCIRVLLIFSFQSFTLASPISLSLVQPQAWRPWCTLKVGRPPCYLG